MVSVCITTYNGEKFIKAQIASILEQLTDEDELVISDDGSTDQTLLLIQSFNDSRIKVFKHDNSKFLKSEFRFNLTTRNMENALLQAKGDYIFMADQDDIWLENRISSVLPLLSKYSLVVSDCKIIDENEAVIKESYFDIINAKQGLLRNLVKNSYLGCCMAFRKEVLESVLPFPKSPVPHDIWIGLISELFGTVSFFDQKLILYRRHGGNLSDSAQASNNSLVFKLKYRLIILATLLSRTLKMNKKIKIK